MLKRKWKIQWNKIVIPLYSLQKTQYSSFSSDFSGKSITHLFCVEAHKRYSSDPKLLGYLKKNIRRKKLGTTVIITLQQRKKREENTGTYHLQSCLPFLHLWIKCLTSTHKKEKKKSGWKVVLLWETSLWQTN